MRLAFFGTPDAAVPSLEAFLDDDGTELAAVVTNPDRPSGRGMRLKPPPVKRVAAQAGVAVWQPTKPREIAASLAALAVDACAVVAYGSLLPADVLDAGGKGFVNLHFSLLPAWRGAAPVQHSLLAGDQESGVTCFVLDAGMDTGPVLSAASTPVHPGETAGELTARLARLGAPMLVRAVKGFVSGALKPHPQADAQATYAPRISAGDAELDWSRDAVAVERAVRAFNPVPGAYTSFDGQRLKIHRAAAVAGDAGPGQVIQGDTRGPRVACGDGALLLLEVQPAGKARMTGADFANGYRPVGRRLGGVA